VPTGGQHYNGQTEGVIRLLKRCLAQSLKGKRCSMMEMATLLVNILPIALGKSSEDPASGSPITPLHLQLGRTLVGISEVKFNLNPSLTNQLQYIDEVKKEFWKKLMAQVF
jgi:hypothetical protein